MNKTLKNIISILFVFAIVISALPTPSDVFAQGELTEVTIQPDGDNMSDIQIVSSEPSTEYETSTELGVGEDNTASSVRRSLLEFDLSGLPYEIYVASATLSIVVDQDFSDNARTMYVYAILKDWGENNTNWNDYGGCCSWQVAGAGGATDYVSEPIGSVALTDDLVAGDIVTISLDTQAVQAMRKENYYGFKLQMDTENNDMYIFRSSDHATAEDRPKLVIEFEDVPISDPGWVCVDGTYAITAPFPDCVSETPMSPYLQSEVRNSDFAGTATGLGAAKLQCEPFPLCQNDYQIYYRVTYDFTWVIPETDPVGDQYATPRFFFALPNLTNDRDISGGYIPCGTGHDGHCAGVLEGVIETSELPVNYDGPFTVGLFVAINTGIWTIATKELQYSIYFSWLPFNQDCADTYYVPLPETFDIDPTIETPLGVLGEPADEQVYATTIGEMYMVRVNDGPWNDGTDDRTDAAVSIDSGDTWMTWDEFSAFAFCIDVAVETATEPDYRILYFSATTDTFMIRVNDDAGMFADNTNSEETPYQYTIGVAYEMAAQTCESQFTYDEGEVFASIPLLNSSDDDGSRAADAFTHYDIFQPGEWYAVKVTSGTWQDNGGPASIEMEYVFTGPTASGGIYQDLAEGSPLVQCVTEDDVVFVQAIDVTLNLRANDGDDDFSNNSGTLSVEIYHAIFERPSETCEMRFAIDDLVRSDSVDGNQDNGKVFALAVGTAVTNSEQDELFLSGGLVPGAWYALETTGGPWGYLANYSYDMAVAEESAGTIGQTPSDDWGPLADWDLAECNVQTDKLGHRMVYFQIPITVAKQWKLRVDGTTAWSLNGGSMSWNLYRVQDLGFTPDGICDYTYTAEGLITPAPQTVNANVVNGASLALSANTFYAVEILGESYRWYEEGGGEPHTDMEVSLNNGQTWGDIPGANVLCAQTAGDNLVFFIHTGTSPQVKLRVNSTTFDNNEGQMGWNIYTAEAGSSVTGCTTTGYSVSSIGPWEWIPVQDEEGRMITSTSASYAEIGGLVPGNKYIIETNRGGWTDGETEINRYSAQVSSDGGATWQSMDGTNPDVDCWEAVTLDYRKIEITVTDGQIWKIRVADVDTETFLDNGGHLAYTLKGLVLPADEIVQGTFNLMGCNTPALAPSLSEVDSFTGLANYLAGWFDYSVASVVNFFAWCPEHTASLSYFGTDVRDREPFATIDEFEATLNDIKNELNSYDWGTSEDYSVLNKSPAQSAAMIQEYIFGPLPDDSPWVNGDLVDLSAVDTTDYYSNCTWAAADYVGPRLAGGVCFASNWAKEVGFTFYIQLMLDVAVMFACIKSTLGVLSDTVAMLTGVNLKVGDRR